MYYKLQNNQHTDFYIKIEDDSITVLDRHKRKTVIDYFANKTKYSVLKILLLYSDKLNKQKDFLDIDLSLSTENMVAQTLKRLRILFTEKYLPKKSVKLIGLHKCSEHEFYNMCNMYFKEEIQNTTLIIPSLKYALEKGYYDNLLEECVNRYELENKIKDKLNKHKICGLIGGPGTGKTVLSVLYSEKTGARIKNNVYDDMFFIRCDNETLFRKSFGIHQYTSDTHYENLLELVFDKIDSMVEINNKYLFVFDNITFDDKTLSSNEYIFFEKFVTDLINKIHISYPNIHVLYTSRANINLNSDYNIFVQDLTYEEAKNYLQDVDYEYSNEDIEKILKMTKLPIILNNMKNLGLMLGGYHMIKSNHSSIGSKKQLNEVLKEIIESLQCSENGRVFIELLKICSILYHSIDINLLVDIAFKFGIDKEKVIASLEEYNYKLNIMLINDNIITIHRSYQECILTYFVSNDDYKYICDNITDIFKRDISEYLYFSMEQSQYIESYILHIDKIFRDKRYTSIDFNYILVMCSYYYGKNYSLEHIYYTTYTSYLMNLKGLDDIYHLSFIKQMVYVNQCVLTKEIHNVERLIQLLDLNMYKQKDINILKIRIYYTLGVIYIYKNFDKSIHYFNTCSKLCDEFIKDLTYDDVLIYMYYMTHSVMSYINIAQNCRKIRKYDENMENGKKALTILEQYNNWSILINEMFSNDIDYFKATINDAIGIALMERSSDEESMKLAETYEINALNLYYSKNKMYECSDIIYNLSLYYNNYLDFINTPKEYLSTAIKSMYYLYISEYIRKTYHIHTRILDIRSHLQKFRNALSFLQYSYNNYQLINMDEIKDLIKDLEINEQFDVDVNSFLDDLISIYDSFNNENEYIQYLYQKALSILNQGLKLCLKTKEKVNYDVDDDLIINKSISVINTVIFCRYYAVLHREAGVLLDDHNMLDLAESYLLRTIKINSRLNFNSQKAFCILELGKTYNVQKKEDLLYQLLSDERVKDVYRQLDDEDKLKKKWYIPMCKKFAVK